MRLCALLLFLVAVQPIDAQPPKHRGIWDLDPVPVPVQPVTPTPALVGEISTEVEESTIAKVNGEWIEADTAKVTAKILVDGNAKWVQVRVSRLVSVTIDGVQIEVRSAEAIKVIEIAAKAGRCFGIIAPPGKYQAEVICSDPQIGITTESAVLEIKGKDPPKPVDPVTPTPDPNDDPNLDTSKLRVLIVEETADRAGLPPGQLAVLTSSKVRRALDALCMKVDGTPEWRIFDDDSDISAESDVWQEAMAKPRSSLPWLLVSDGKQGVSMPLPKSVDEMLGILETFSK